MPTPTTQAAEEPKPAPPKVRVEAKIPDDVTAINLTNLKLKFNYNHRPELRTVTSPTLRFTPYAFAKLLYLRDAGGTEVGGFGLTKDKDDPLLIHDIIVPKQRTSVATVDFDMEDMAEQWEALQEEGYQPFQYSTIWIHTHPGSSSHPSGTDETTFGERRGGSWAVMFILAKGGSTYARIKVNDDDNYYQALLNVEIDYNVPFPGTDLTAWEEIYDTCVNPIGYGYNQGYQHQTSSGGGFAGEQKTSQQTFHHGDNISEWEGHEYPGHFGYGYGSHNVYGGYGSSPHYPTGYQGGYQGRYQGGYNKNGVASTTETTKGGFADEAPKVGVGADDPEVPKMGKARKRGSLQEGEATGQLFTGQASHLPVDATPQQQADAAGVSEVDEEYIEGVIKTIQDELARTRSLLATAVSTGEIQQAAALEDAIEELTRSMEAAFNAREKARLSAIQQASGPAATATGEVTTTSRDSAGGFAGEQGKAPYTPHSSLPGNRIGFHSEANRGGGVVHHPNPYTHRPAKPYQTVPPTTPTGEKGGFADDPAPKPTVADVPADMPKDSHDGMMC